MKKSARYCRCNNVDDTKHYSRDIGIRRVLPLVNDSSSTILARNGYFNGEYQKEHSKAIDWRGRTLEERVMWDWKDIANKKLSLVSKTSRGITKSRSYGLNFFGKRISLGETGFIVALVTTLVGVVGLNREIWSLIAVRGESIATAQMIESIFSLLLNITVVIMGGIGILSAKMNHTLDKLNGNISDKILFLPNDGTDWIRQRNERRCDYLKSKELQQGLANSIRVDGPRYLLIGISMFLVNDIVNVLGSWLDIVINAWGNPNFPEPFSGERISFSPSPKLIVQSSSYVLAVIIMVGWVVGWLLSWWEVIRVGFISIEDVRFNGWPSKELQYEGEGMRKLFFSTGFEGQNCWELSMIQLELRYEFQRDKSNTKLEGLDLIVHDLSGRRHHRGGLLECESIGRKREAVEIEEFTKRTVEIERVREIEDYLTYYNVTTIKSAEGNIYYASTTDDCHGITEAQSRHNETNHLEETSRVIKKRHQIKMVEEFQTKRIMS